jgi:hypothetical protein
MAQVPEGKRWIIEHVSAIAQMSGGEGQSPTLAIMIGNNIVHWVVFSPQGGSNYATSQPLKLRLSAGELLRFNFGRASTAGSAHVAV